MSSLNALDASLQHLKPVQTLKNCLNLGRIPHAFLLHGPCLKPLEDIALALTQSLLGKPQTKLSETDYFYLRPTNKMRQIDAEATRELLQKLYQTSKAAYKVAIIYEADRLNTYAANALLKTLEEPPSKTALILLSTRPYEVLPTILSRCFQFKISTPSPSLEHAEWESWLQDLHLWLQALVEGTSFNKTFLAESILGAYGLIYRFESILEQMLQDEEKHTKALKQKDEADSPLKAEEKIAQETARLKDIRQQLLKATEKAIRDSVLHVAKPLQPSSVLSLCQTIQTFEDSVRLLDVNLQISTALEGFFLQTLKLWIRNKA